MRTKKAVQDAVQHAGEHAGARVDEDEVRRFFEIIAPGEKITFQTFTDAHPGTKKPSPDPLARVLHGYLEDRLGALRDLNASGAGVFWMVNRGDGKGRRTQNVIEVRRPFVDLDGAPIAPLKESQEPPRIIVESSPGRYHAYWQEINCPLDCFTPMQIALARHFSADESVSDLPRVLRVPGFLHQKKTPFMTRVTNVLS